ncbi:hypothetical protein ACQUEF_08370 [Vagococcus fluvialis]|uniref:hypothetical protein n=1 Tax=Vagococcus fluvialis TaxID=2738 RepID=UPI003D0C5CAE
MFSLKMTTYKNVLLGYWIFAPMCFYLYLIMTSSMKQIPITDLLTHVPGITLAFLMALLMLVQAATIFFIQQHSTSQNGLLGHFLSFSFFQQLLTGNIVGAIICFFYKRSLYSKEENITLLQKIFVIGLSTVISLFSLLSIFILWRLKGA